MCPQSWFLSPFGEVSFQKCRVLSACNVAFVWLVVNMMDELLVVHCGCSVWPGQDDVEGQGEIEEDDVGHDGSSCEEVDGALVFVDNPEASKNVHRHSDNQFLSAGSEFVCLR